jgi:hypothetical protein
VLAKCWEGNRAEYFAKQPEPDQHRRSDAAQLRIGSCRRVGRSQGQVAYGKSGGRVRWDRESLETKPENLMKSPHIKFLSRDPSLFYESCGNAPLAAPVREPALTRCISSTSSMIASSLSHARYLAHTMAFNLLRACK